MFFLTGVARYLFVPLAEAVVFAILASYIISRTLVPMLVMWLYRDVKLHGEHIDHSRFLSGFCRSSVSKTCLKRALTISATAIAPCLRAVLNTANPSPFSSSCFASARGCSWKRSARIFSPAWTPGSFYCTCARPPARASRKPNVSPARSTASSTVKFRRANLAAFSTTSAFPIPRSI